MIVPLSWLKNYVDIDISAENLGEELTMAGLEVEAVEYRGKGIEDVIVAEIKEIAPHPDADRLSLCDVTDGENSYKIVCGATNMRSGDKVALATIGTNLPPTSKFPEGLKIKKTKIRGEVSEGMLCAENELGLSEESEGIMILPFETPLGATLTDALDVEDTIFEIGITPNRPDCLSIIGVAREVAAITGKELRYPDISLNDGGVDIKDIASVKIENKDACPRYSCRVINGVKIDSSPKWLESKLESCGIRAINNVVDITNFVLMECGQPLHAFDYDLLSENRIEVRLAEDSEEIQTLDGEKRKLTTDDLLICDGRKPVALAGVMGGANSEVNENTRNILLESAYFDPITVRKTSKRTGLRSESSYRFERGVDPNGVVIALDRAAALIAELAGGNVAEGVIDVYPNLIEPVEIKLSLEKVNRLLGAKIEEEKIKDILRSVEFEIVSFGDGYINIRIPTYRVDITREIDLIEEIGRLFGYNNISSVPPSVQMHADSVTVDGEVSSRLRHFFISQGFFEAINYSFENTSRLKLIGARSALELLNPLTTENSVMRTTLIIGLLDNIKLNQSRQVQDIKLFEIGKVFYPNSNGELPEERKKFTAVATGSKEPEVWKEGEFDFFDLKGVVCGAFDALSLNCALRFEEISDTKFLHHGKSSKIYLGSREIGFIGQLHPDFLEEFELEKKVYLLEINLDELFETYPGVSRVFTPLPKFPSVKRDLSLIVDRDISSGEILEKMKKVSNLVEDAWVFDVFEGENVQKGKKSVGVSMLLRARDKTLTDEEAKKVQKKALNKLNSVLGAELRSI